MLGLISFMDNLDDIVKGIGKGQGTIKRSLSEAIIEISIVEGDEKNKWVIVVNDPYRSTKFSKGLTDWEAIRRLRQVRLRFKQALDRIDRDIKWINGDIDENNNIQD